MFANHWIVADMDGTLTPTPTRAHGKYLSLSHCMTTGLGYGARYRSCLPWLRFFLERGGSLCVVSTAGIRMWSQLYQDLAPAVFSLGTPSANGGNNTDVDGPAEPPATTPGALYLCGFTGAAMFRTRPCALVWADMRRLYPGWQPSSASTASALLKDASGPGIATVPPPAVGMEEWEEYRQQAVRCVDKAESSPVSAEAAPSSSTLHSPSSSSSSTTLDIATYTLASQEGRSAIIRFFEHASYISGHDLGAAADFFAACLSTKYHAVFTEILRQLLAEVEPALLTTRHDGAVPHLCFADSQVLTPYALAQHGYFLKETNDALVDAQQVPHADGSLTKDAPVAQVVVMGIPMRYFEAIFPSASSSTGSTTATTVPAWQCCPKCAAVGTDSKARIEAAGLELKSQPNSVCLHRRGVDKGMCVRWLQSQGAQQKMSFDLAKALAFGDVPDSVDRPLTEYPPMQFLSLSPKVGAAERLAELSTPATSSSTLQPMLYHVGGEEEGTALFLEELLTSCTRDAAKESSSGTRKQATWFTPSRVSACAARAQASLLAEMTARGTTEATGEPSRSTL